MKGRRRREGRKSGCSTKNKNPTRQCVEISIYIYIYISSILIYIHTFTSYKNILHPLPPLPHHQGVQYLYIYIYTVVIPIPYEPLAVNNEAGKLLLGGKYPKNFGDFFCSVLEAFHKGIPAGLVLMHLLGFAFLHFAEVFLTGEWFRY